MFCLSKVVILGFLTGLLGLVVSFTPFGLDLEENVGLGLLFKLRGAQQAPSDVLMVSVDKASAINLSLPYDPRKWPRSFYARLVEILAEKGVSVIAFDIIFEEPGPLRDDDLFADAIHKAGNVVLFKYLYKQTIPLTDKRGLPAGDLIIERPVLPVRPLEQAAIALAPFPLPKVPVRVNQYWAFKTSAGDTPTLPVVAFQVFALEVYEDFVYLLKRLKRINPSQIKNLPPDRDTLVTAFGVEKFIRTVRHIFENEPEVAENMLKELENLKILAGDQRKRRILQGLIRMYQRADSQYLNFYGPPGTITKVPYYEVLQLQEKSVTNPPPLDLKGKAVFVGLSENLQRGQKDGFYTVFSQSNGLDLSGVEIAATAFANLLEGKPVQPLPLPNQLAIIFFWGLILGALCWLPSIPISAVGTVGLSLLYFMVVYHQFKDAGHWYPLVFPLFFQAPLAFFGTVLWKYYDVHKERQNIRKAFGYYLPTKVVDQMAKNIAHIQTSSQLVYGVCLYTDAEKYTNLAESMDPRELSKFINKYYEAVFEPIQRYGGIVSDIIGDSMLAIWSTAQPNLALKSQSCLAALGIADAAARFNQSNPFRLKLPTSIGLHFGQILLGHVGAIHHYEYRAVGDVVNTTTRLQGLNKHLGTCILASEEVLDQLDGFLTRELGKFLLVGKSRPLRVHELIARMETCSGQQSRLCVNFAVALDAYKRQSWEEAIEKFHGILKNHGEDGPSLFYLRLCQQYQENPPEEPWNEVVRIGKK